VCFTFDYSICFRLLAIFKQTILLTIKWTFTRKPLVIIVELVSNGLEQWRCGRQEHVSNLIHLFLFNQCGIQSKNRIGIQTTLPILFMCHSFNVPWKEKAGPAIKPWNTPALLLQQHNLTWCTSVKHFRCRSLYSWYPCSTHT